jgi:hypothetical protein
MIGHSQFYGHGQRLHSIVIVLVRAPEELAQHFFSIPVPEFLFLLMPEDNPLRDFKRLMLLSEKFVVFISNLILS